MSNTIIQIKRSLTSSQPSSLHSAELGYSYQSNTIFIGTPDGTGTIAIGGKAYLDIQNNIYTVANAAFGAANSQSASLTAANQAGVIANAAFDLTNVTFGRANSIYDLANAAFDKANSDITSADSANAYTNVSTTSANNYAGFMANAANAYAASVGLAGNAYAVVVGASSNAHADAVGVNANTHADAVGVNANTYASSVGVAANAFAVTIGAASNAHADQVGTNANTYADLVGTSANAYASATYYAKTGGAISGDVSITGNLTVTGATLYANTTHLWVGDNNIVLNAELPSGSAPLALNSGLSVNRGTSPNTFFVWDESLTSWAFTNDGSTYLKVASNTDIAAGNAYASSVGVAANVYAAAVGVSANAYADVVGAAANTNAANGSYISTGVVKVPYGGTGVTSATLNGVLFGNGTDPLQVTGAGTEGQVLQANASGVPFFGVLDGGAF